MHEDSLHTDGSATRGSCVYLAVVSGGATLEVARLQHGVVRNGGAGGARHGARDLAALHIHWQQRAEPILQQSD